MAPWMVWAILAASTVILELFSGTFYLLMIAIGMASGALVAWYDGTFALQLITAAVVGVVATLLLRKNMGKTLRTDAAGDANIHIDIGQAVQIDQWNGQNASGAAMRTRALYRGAMWDVELVNVATPSQEALPGRYLIREVRGNCLAVEGPY